MSSEIPIGRSLEHAQQAKVLQAGPDGADGRTLDPGG
jgi:hypothetical protein